MPPPSQSPLNTRGDWRRSPSSRRLARHRHRRQPQDHRVVFRRARHRPKVSADVLASLSGQARGQPLRPGTSPPPASCCLHHCTTNGVTARTRAVNPAAVTHTNSLANGTNGLANSAHDANRESRRGDSESGGRYTDARAGTGTAGLIRGGEHCAPGNSDASTPPPLSPHQQ